VFIPKCRRKTLYGELRRHLGEVFRKLAVQKESRIEEGHLMPDHDHLDPTEIRSLPGGRLYQGQECDPFGSGLRGEEAQFRGAALLGQRILVSTVGRDEAVIREYIKKQEQEDSRLDQMNLWR
jgi:putative transposase